MSDVKIYEIIPIVILLMVIGVTTANYYLDKQYDEPTVITKSVNDTIKCVITDKKISLQTIRTTSSSGGGSGALTGYIIGGMFGFPITGAIIGSSETPKTNIYIVNDYLFELNDSVWVNVGGHNYSQFIVGDTYNLIKYK